MGRRRQRLRKRTHKYYIELANLIAKHIAYTIQSHQHNQSICKELSNLSPLWQSFLANARGNANLKESAKNESTKTQQKLIRNAEATVFSKFVGCLLAPNFRWENLAMFKV